MDWTPACEWLSENGFERVNSAEPLVIVHSGFLHTKYGKVSVKITLDGNGIEFPKLELDRKPAWLPKYCAHLGENLILCCTDSATASPDRRVPAAQVREVLKSGVLLLESLVETGGNVEDEFVKLWQTIPPYSMVLPKTIEKEKAWCWVQRFPEDPWMCLAPANKVPALAHSFGKAVRTRCLPPILINLTVNPRASGLGWPVETFSNLLEWLRYLDISAWHDLLKGLKKTARYIVTQKKVSRGLTVVIRQGNNYFGINFLLPKYDQWDLVIDFKRKEKSAASIFKEILNRPHLIGYRCRLLDISSTRILARTLGEDMKSFSGMNVILIGAGSVGSFLAQALVRSGAGTGGGELTVYDPDVVGVENIPRSIYDSRHLAYNKAVALKSVLVDAMTDLKVVPRNQKAPTDSSLLSADLIFDASGDHAFSAWLSDQVCNGRVSPVLYAWVCGRGAAVMTYLQPHSGAPCLSCLAVADKKSSHNPLVYSEEMALHALGACGETFMPYSVAAPMLAAGLATTHALDWIRGVPGRSIRTISMSSEFAKDIVDDAIESCPHSTKLQ